MNQLIYTTELGHVWHTDCAKCGTRQKVRIGDCTLSEARSAISTLDRTPMECPGGFHTELGGWSRMWNLDEMLAELQRKEDASNEAAIGRDLQKCDLIEALGDDQAKAAATTQRKECFDEIRQMNERDGLNTGQTDEELLAELAEPVIDVQAEVVEPAPQTVEEIATKDASVHKVIDEIHAGLPASVLTFALSENRKKQWVIDLLENQEWTHQVTLSPAQMTYQWAKEYASSRGGRLISLIVPDPEHAPIPQPESAQSAQSADKTVIHLLTKDEFACLPPDHEWVLEVARYADKVCVGNFSYGKTETPEGRAALHRVYLRYKFNGDSSTVPLAVLQSHLLSDEEPSYLSPDWFAREIYRQLNPPEAKVKPGIRFTVPEHTCIWTVLSYHRGGYWVCQEPDHMTTCHFHHLQILAGIVSKDTPYVENIAPVPHPELSTPKLLTAGQDGNSRVVAAKNIRLELAHHFPGIKFSVKGSTFSMGDAIDVHWTMGPTTNEVDAVIDRYQECDFDGSDDSTHYRTGEARKFTDAHGGAKYVTANRSTIEAWRIIGHALCIEHGIEDPEPFDKRDYHSVNLGLPDTAGVLANLMLYETSLPPGVTVTGIQLNPNTTNYRNKYMPRFDALNPTATTPTASFPRALAIRLMAQPHECQVGPSGDHNAEFRRDVLEKLTGKRPPKAKAGCTLVRSTLATHYNITDSTCGADHDDQIRDGLRRTIFAEFPNTAPAFQQELRDISTIGGEPIEKIYALWCVYDYRNHDQSSLVWEFKRQHAFDLGLTEEGTARERYTASPTPPSGPSKPSKPSTKSIKPTPQGDLIRKIPAGTFAFLSSTPDGEAVRTAFAAWVDAAGHTGDWRKLFAAYQSEAVSLTAPAAAQETPAADEGACILTDENMHTADDCTAHDHEPVAPVTFKTADGRDGIKAVCDWLNEPDEDGEPAPSAKRGPWSDCKPGTNVRFVPHDPHRSLVIGMLRDLVNDGDGANIFSPRGPETSRTLRVWERDGRMEAAPSRYHVLVGKGALEGVQSMSREEIEEWNRLCAEINGEHHYKPDHAANIEAERRILKARREGKRLKVERLANGAKAHLPEMFSICCGLEGDPGYDIGELRGYYATAADAQRVIRNIEDLAACLAKATPEPPPQQPANILPFIQPPTAAESALERLRRAAQRQ